MELSVSKAKTDKVLAVHFTDDQQKAYDGLIKWIKEPFKANDYKRALVGPAGTGKTFLVKSIISNCGLSYSTIALSAPTHKAVRVLTEAIRIPNVTINTLQSDLGLRVNFNVDNFDINNVPFDPNGRVKLEESINLYIVDEASMINRGLLSYLEKYIVKNCIKLLYIGDASQLFPVKDNYSPAFYGVELFELRQVVRQGDNNPISYLLNLLRYDIKHKSFYFLDYIYKVKEKYSDDLSKGYSVVDTTDFERGIDMYFKDDNITKDTSYAKVVAYTNPCVNGWNKIIRHYLIDDSEKAVINKHDLIVSYTTIVDDFNSAIIKNSEEYIIHDITNYVNPKYDLKGYVVRFQAVYGGKITTPLFILDHKDKFSFARYMQIVDELINAAKTASPSTKASRWKEYYKFKESVLICTNVYNLDMTVKYSRDLDYGFALTAHKSQGSTFENVFVDIDDIVYDKNGNPYTDVEAINRRLYVACSRAKNKLYLKYQRAFL